MVKSNIGIAVAYYTAMGAKNAEEALKYLHSDVHLISPLAEIKGKDIVREAIKGFMASFNSIHIRAMSSNEDSAILVIDVEYPAPIGLLRTASFVTMREGLISRIELFHDAKLFVKRDGAV